MSAKQRVTGGAIASDLSSAFGLPSAAPCHARLDCSVLSRLGAGRRAAPSAVPQVGEVVLLSWRERTRCMRIKNSRARICLPRR